MKLTDDGVGSVGEIDGAGVGDIDGVAADLFTVVVECGEGEGIWANGYGNGNHPAVGVSPIDGSGNPVHLDGEDIYPATPFEIDGAVGLREIVTSVGGDGEDGVRWKSGQGEATTGIDIGIKGAKAASGN